VCDYREMKRLLFFLAAAPLQSDDSIEVRIAAGSAIVYATTVDNVTNDGAIQLLRR
jgi:hypothetical protein